MFAKMWIVASLIAPVSVAHAGQPCKPSALSQASQEELRLAEDHYNTGANAFESQRWDVAAIEFLASYSLSHKPELLYNLSLTAEKAGKLTEAIAYAEQHICEAAAILPQTEADEVRGRLARLRDTLKGGGTVAPPAPEPARSDRVAGPEHSSHRFPPGGWALVGLGSGLVLVGIGLGAGALATAAQFDGTPLTMGQIQDLTTRGQALDRAGIALDVLGGVSLAAGAGWLLWSRLHQRKLATVKPLVFAQTF